MSQADPLKDQRSKCRYVLELRYNPLVQIFDRRGRVLEKIFPLFQKKAEHWKVDNSQIVIADNFDGPLKMISIGHMATSIAYEDPDTLSEFIDDSSRLIKNLKEVFPEGVKIIRRIGFRSISIFRQPKLTSYEDVFNSSFQKLISKDFPSTLKFNDFNITLAHDSCRVLVGPCREGESWIKGNFNDLDKNIPKYGLGLDVDSFALDLVTEDVTSLLNAVHMVQNLGFSTESEIVRSLS